LKLNLVFYAQNWCYKIIFGLVPVDLGDKFTSNLITVGLLVVDIITSYESITVLLDPFSENYELQNELLIYGILYVIL